MTEPFDPRKTDVFEPVTPAEADALAATAAAPDPAPVDEDGVPVAAAPLVPQTPPAVPGRLRRLLFRDGHFNRRAGFVLAGLAFIGLLWASGDAASDAPAPRAANRPDPMTDAPATPTSAHPLRSAALPAANLGSVSAPPPTAAAGKPAAQPTAPQPPFGAPPSALAPTPANPTAPRLAAGKPGGASAPPVADAQAAPDTLKSFVIPLRDAAAARTASSTTAAAKAPAAAPETDAPATPTIPRGTRIPLRLLEPLVTGAAAPAAAVVLEDVLTESGEVLIPKGTRAEIPFMGYDANGRIPNNRAQPALFLVTDVPGGLSAKGGVKGADGRAGLSGTVTQERPGFLKRMLGASARVGTAAVGGLGPGDVTGEVERAAGLDSVATISPAGRRVCEVPKGAPFVFIVGF
jgi:hypothetical protein